MKPIQHHKDPRISNITLENFTGTVYVIDRNINDDNHQSETMLTSSQTTTAENFMPNHHLTLITQPVLGARSRKKTKHNSTLDNHSPPLILPINRIDTSQFQKKYSSNYHESSDSGVDLSLSTNSSVQFQQYSQQHNSLHRPLSALNEDSSPDDGYHDEHIQLPSNPPPRLKFPPVNNFGRNRSMEDIISNNHREQQQQHRSSSFSDERQQKIARINDGHIQDFIDSSSQSTESSRRIHPNHKIEHSYLSPTQQHRSLNDLTNKTSTKVHSSRNESNTSSKVNTSTVKPLRKKTKLNLLNEPSSIPLTSSRLAVYDEQINTTSSSSNQTTPRSIHPQQNKSKPSTTLSHYSNSEQIRAHVNRSVVERQQLPHPPLRRGLIQQMIPFDASPSKVNNLLLRHHLQQNQPTVIFYPNSTSRHIKQTLPVLHHDQTIRIIHEDKKRSKQKHSSERKLRKKFDKNHFNEDEQSIIRQQQTNINQRYGSGHSSTNTGKIFDQYQIDRRQRNILPTNIYRSDGELIQTKNIRQSNGKTSSRISDISNQYGSDNSHHQQRNILVDANPRSKNILLQTQIDQNQQKILSQGKSLNRLSDLRSREYEINRLNNLSKTDSIPINDQSTKSKILKKISLNPLPPKSPTSSSIISERPPPPELPLSSPSHDNSIDENLNTPRTYRLRTDEQPLDGRHVIPSTNLQTSHSSSDETHPFHYTPDAQIIEKKKSQTDIYVLSDDDDDHHRNGPSPLVHLTKPKKKYFSPPPKNVNLSEEKDEIISNYDSDDGWSDDSAELLYIDERYANEQGKFISPSHLSSQKRYHHPIQQQNVLLQ